jgi:hypothetical protein
LLGRFPRDPFEPLENFARGAEGLRPRGRDESQAVCGQLRSLFHEPGEALRPQPGDEERDTGSRVARGQELFDEDLDAASAEGRYDGEGFSPAAVEEHNRVARPEPARAGVRGLLFRNVRFLPECGQGRD